MTRKTFSAPLKQSLKDNVVLQQMLVRAVQEQQWRAAVAQDLRQRKNTAHNFKGRG